jgi:hypothetical protein
MQLAKGIAWIDDKRAPEDRDREKVWVKYKNGEKVCVFYNTLREVTEEELKKSELTDMATASPAKEAAASDAGGAPAGSGEMATASPAEVAEASDAGGAPDAVPRVFLHGATTREKFTELLKEMQQHLKEETEESARKVLAGLDDIGETREVKTLHREFSRFVFLAQKQHRELIQVVAKLREEVAQTLQEKQEGGSLKIPAVATGSLVTVEGSDKARESREGEVEAEASTKNLLEKEKLAAELESVRTNHQQEAAAWRAEKERMARELRALREKSDRQRNAIQALRNNLAQQLEAAISDDDSAKTEGRVRKRRDTDDAAAPARQGTRLRLAEADTSEQTMEAAHSTVGQF